MRLYLLLLFSIICTVCTQTVIVRIQCTVIDIISHNEATLCVIVVVGSVACSVTDLTRFGSFLFGSFIHEPKTDILHLLYSAPLEWIRR